MDVSFNIKGRSVADYILQYSCAPRRGGLCAAARLVDEKFWSKGHIKYLIRCRKGFSNTNFRTRLETARRIF